MNETGDESYNSEVSTQVVPFIGADLLAGSIAITKGRDLLRTLTRQRARTLSKTSYVDVKRSSEDIDTSAVYIGRRNQDELR